MALNTTPTTSYTHSNRINIPFSQKGIDSDKPYLVGSGFHAGAIDFSRWQSTIDAYVGVGLNSYGFYGISYDPLGNLPNYLVSVRGWKDSDWGNVIAGEFRIGDNVKEDNGTLVGTDWLWYKPGVGLNISGPLLRTTSSDTNLITSPNFDSSTEFETTFTHQTSGGFSDSACFVANADGYLRVKGNKTTDGSTHIRGSIFSFISPDFIGDISIVAKVYNKDDEYLGQSSTAITVLGSQWRKSYYALRIDSYTDLFPDHFTIELQITNYQSGSVIFDNWNAYKVFTSAFSNLDLSETLPDIPNGTVVDATGFRAFSNSNLTFKVDAASGNVFTRGSLLVNGYVHSGHIYKADNTETIDPYEVVYWNGCGVNEYGIYGIKAEVDQNGNHVSSTSKFLLAAKEFGDGDPNGTYWGMGAESGEFRVGDDCRKVSTYSLAGNSYIWFEPSTGNLKIKGADVSASAFIATTEINNIYYWSAFNDTGFASGYTDGATSTYTFFVSNHGGSLNTDPGELRLGGDVASRATSSLWFTPTDGLHLEAPLKLSPNDTSGTSVYIGIEDTNGDTYISGQGIALRDHLSSSWRAFLLNSTHDFAKNNNAIFYVGSGYTEGISPNLGTSYLYWDGLNLYINGHGIEVKDDSTTIGTNAGDDVELTNLHLSGALTLSNSTTASPSSYIGIESSSGDTYINGQGIALRDHLASSWKGFLLNSSHPFAKNNNPVFYVGSGYTDGTNPTLGTSYLYWNGSNLYINGHGIDVAPTTTTIGTGNGNDVKLTNLELTGKLTLTGSSNTSGVPSSYIGVVGTNSATYISSDGIAIRANNTWQAFLLGSQHPFADSTNAVFYVGNGYVNGSNLGSNHIYFNGSTLDITISGETILHAGSDLDWDKLNGVPAPVVTNEYVKTISATGWYRIASNPGNRAHAKFLIKNTENGRHQTTEFLVGVAYNRVTQIGFSLLANTTYGANVITKVRVLTADTYDAQYVEVYIDNPAGSTDGYHIYMKDNIQTDGWTLRNFTAGSIPSGYTATEFPISNADTVGNTANWDKVDGANKPEDNATQGADWALTSDGISGLPSILTPSISGMAHSTGISVKATEIVGFKSGTKTVHLDSSGNFALGSTGGTRYLYWDGSSLTVKGEILATSGQFLNTFYVGTSSNGILLNAINAPYMRSTTFDSSSGSDSSYKGWQLNANGDIYTRRIVGKYLDSNGNFVDSPLWVIGESVHIAPSYTYNAGGQLHLDHYGGTCVFVNTQGQGKELFHFNSVGVGFLGVTPVDKQSLGGGGNLYSYPWSDSSTPTTDQLEADISNIASQLNTITQLLYKFGLASNNPQWS